MKTINLPALAQITFEEIGSFLSWMNQQPPGGTSLAQMQKAPPIRTSKLNPMLKTLEQFGFIALKQSRFSITPRGADFLRSEVSVRKAVVKTLLTQVEWVEKVVLALGASPNGRLHRSVISDAFFAASRTQIAESELVAFIAWGELSELFGFDKKTYELVRVEPIVPHDPRPVAPTLRLAS